MAQEDLLDSKPLYKQVYDYLIRQIIDGKWRATDKLPSEHDLAALLGVSQGTVRKALDVMVAENLIERRQGKGTVVSEQTQARATFRFFRLALPNNGGRISPQCANTVIARRASKVTESAVLELKPKTEVFEISRLRMLAGRPIATEQIVIPAELFKDLERSMPLPNALYSLYQGKFGIHIVLAEEELSVISASKADAKKLQVDAAFPLLQINRVAIGVDGKKIELRKSHYNMDGLVYSVDLR